VKLLQRIPTIRAKLGSVIVVAVGMTLSGEKIVLGLVEAGTENATVCADLLTELVERGLRFEDGLLVVIDGGGSLRSALVGDGIAEWARDHGWAGMIINGCVRDTVALAKVDLGVMAIGVNPVTPGKRRVGARDVAVTFGDVRFVPGEYAYCDEDGVVIATERLNT